MVSIHLYLLLYSYFLINYINIILFLALTALLVGFGLLEVGERLSHSRGSHGARAALDFRHAVGVFADELALGFGAAGLVTLPVASGLFAHGLALRLGSLAVSHAVRLLAHGDALRAVE